MLNKSYQRGLVIFFPLMILFIGLAFYIWDLNPTPMFNENAQPLNLSASLFYFNLMALALCTIATFIGISMWISEGN
jgi:predicted membrane protein